MDATDEQKAMLMLFAAGTDFKLDLAKSIKAEFTRLAIYYRGWKGGDESWNAHWLACFEEEYFSYRSRRMSYPTASASI